MIRAFLDQEPIIVDSFAGGGGASSGLEAAGIAPHIAINHDPVAIAMHKANHPETKHYCESVWKVDPVEACGGRPVKLMWLSPTCTFFSKAKGTPLSEAAIKARGLCWVAVTWATKLPPELRPQIICLENVEEFQKFGPLHRDHSDGCPADPFKPCPVNAKKKRLHPKCRYCRPIKSREGSLFRAFISKLERLGYVVEYRLLRASEFGAPTSRRRFFLVARCDGKSIVWPKQTHAAPDKCTPENGLQPWRTAAECIDWSIPCPSIFERDEELVDKTKQRIARGIIEFVMNNPKPFIVPVAYGDKGGTDVRVHDIDEPLRTICGNRGGSALVSPILLKAKTYGGGGNDAMPIDEPIRTITCSKRGEFGAATAVLVRTDMHQSNSACSYSPEEPLRTITTAPSGGFGIVTPILARTAHGERDQSGKRRGKGAHSVDEPLPTVCASSTDFAVVAPHLIPVEPGAEAPEAIGIPFLTHQSNGERPGQAPRIYDIEEPLRTIVSGGIKHALSVALLIKNHGGHESKKGGQAVDRPIDTIATRDQKSLTVATMVKIRGTSDAHIAASPVDLHDPMPTISTGGDRAGVHVGAVSAFLVRFQGNGNEQSPDQPLGTLTTKDRYGLATVWLDGEEYIIADIGFRMLTPRELFIAQGFDPAYNIEPEVEVEITRGRRRKRVLRRVNKTEQIKCVGNSVPPVMAKVIAQAQLEAA